MILRHVTLAMTGASGAIYGLRLAEELLQLEVCLSVLITAAGFAVLREEHGLEWEGTADQVREKLISHFAEKRGSSFSPTLSYFSEDDFCAAIASGSAASDAMVICPCSMGTLSRIACGNSGNLLERCADVMLKERRPLILVPRETPLNAIHLENMLKLSRLGAQVLPAMPAFYHRPQSVEEMVDFVVGKILDSLAIDHSLFRRWGQDVMVNP